jgi:hypothetical protein
MLTLRKRSRSARLKAFSAFSEEVGRWQMLVSGSQTGASDMFS